MENKKEIKLSYGALSDPLETQLNQQGFTLADKQEFIHKLHNSLSMCMFHLLTDSQYQSSLKKLHKKVMDNIKLL
jgi:outer membrane lipopolysaccharide assembly protein LptE/RlpB